MNAHHKPSILLLFGTHGVKECLKYIPKKFHEYFDVLDMNEEAIQKWKRYVQYDMNRTAPWDSNSEMYELQRWSQVQKIMSEYTIVIDIHGTLSDTGSFILLPRATVWHIFLASLFQSKNIVFWQSWVWKPEWPIVGFHPLGLEIETWPMNDITIQELAKNLITFLENFRKNYSFMEYLKLLSGKNFYDVIGRLDRKTRRKYQKKIFIKLISMGDDTSLFSPRIHIQIQSAIL